MIIINDSRTSQGLFKLFERNISEKVMEHLDNGQYNDGDLVELKIPFPMLYANNWKEYERFDGELEMGGIHYNYVKRKFSNDTMYLLCRPDHERTKLNIAKIDYLKNTNDGVSAPGEKKSSFNNSSQKSLTWEQHDMVATLHLTTPAVWLTTDYFSPQYHLPGALVLAPFQPPQL